MQRLFVEESFLVKNCNPTLKEKQIHYLLHVLRVKVGEELLLFNGKDGEWRAKITNVEKRNLDLLVIHKEREQTQRSNLVYCFAPLKKARLDYMVQKAVEMGVGVLQPVITDRTQRNSFFKMKRINAISLEAAEQCGILSPPLSLVPVSLHELVRTWQPDRYLVFCDETEEPKSPLLILQDLERADFGLIIGPEGGFSERERSLLKKQDFVKSISLGPRILRADTAAVAALSLLNTILGE